MRKKWSALLALMMIMALSVPALAEGVCMDGEIVCVSPVSVRAPFGGQIEDFTLRTGMRLDAGETVLSIATQAVYAPVDGIVTGVAAQPGESVESVLSRYGALCYIENENIYAVTASTANAYNDEENKIVYAGETVYLKNPNVSGREGVGVITSVNGSAFSIEITDKDTLRLANTVDVYREDDYDEKSRIGRGQVERAASTAVTGAGSVLAVHIEEGQQVKRGELLFETVAGEMDGYAPAGAAVCAPEAGSLKQVNVSAGSRVQKDDVLFILHPDTALEALAYADEEDVVLLEEGMEALVTLDALEGVTAKGEIVSIAGVPDAQGYAVYVAFTLPEGAREGMSVQVEIE